MSNQVSRRDFVKAAGVAAAGVAIATTYSPFSYAQNEKVLVASIGTGGQGSFHLDDGIGRAQNIKVVAVCDVYKPHLEAGWRKAGGGDVKMYMDYREMLDKEEIDAVVIATPLHTHHRITMDCLDAGKYCFTEKTLCYTIEDSQEIVKKSHETGKFVQVGHQRRYNPMYNKAVMLARDEGVLGRINYIECQWHRNNDWRRPVNTDYVLSPEEAKWITDLEHHINWRLYNATSGGLMTELATHQIDVAAWFLDAMPKRVYGYGGIDYWRDGREVYDNVSLVYEFEITPKNLGYRAINARNRYQDKKAINEPYVVRVPYSSITANAKKGATELILGDEGSFELMELGGLFYQEPTSKVKWADQGTRSAEQENATVITSGGTLKLSNLALKSAKEVTVDNDKSVDQIQFEAFANDIKTGGTPQANVMVGHRSAVMGLAGLVAMHEHRQVEIDPAWYTFDFDTPDPSGYSVYSS